MRDLIPPAVARGPVEAIEIVSLAISDGDLETALAQYEHDAILRPWQVHALSAAGPGGGDAGGGDAGGGGDPGGGDPGGRDAGGGDAGPAARGLRDVMDLRLPLALRVLAVVPAGDLSLVLAERRISGAGPDCERVELAGSGAAIVRRQPGGSWRIAADAWCLTGAGGPCHDPERFPGDSP